MRKSPIPVKGPLISVLWHPTRHVFLGITQNGSLSYHTTAPLRTIHPFDITVTHAAWYDNESRVVVTCEDLSVRILDFEAKTNLYAFSLTAQISSMSFHSKGLVIGTKKGRCEIWNISLTAALTKTVGTVVEKSENRVIPIISAQWVLP
jgi:WD40 repeat protein